MCAFGGDYKSLCVFFRMSKLGSMERNNDALQVKNCVLVLLTLEDPDDAACREKRPNWIMITAVLLLLLFFL